MDRIREKRFIQYFLAFGEILGILFVDFLYPEIKKKTVI
jgi:hypothetical protein